ncbi:hypothetical protein WJX81_006389 [Elliptochloris bilobata]|uniref:DNA helicase n=1 Tax=Elliptochloris bilobata TaxID=381761 RepID=A0AAW1QKD8_9CHLO
MVRMPLKRGSSLSQRLAAFASLHGIPWRRSLASDETQAAMMRTTLKLERLLRALDIERSNGFSNSTGQVQQFDTFLHAELQQVRAQAAGYHRRDLDALHETGCRYAELDARAREAFLARLASVLASLQWGARHGEVSPPASKASPMGVLPARPRLFVFDTETTGFSKQEDEIVEIAALDVETGAEFDSGLINIAQSLTRKQMSRGAADITGITTADVTRPGLPSMREVGPRLLAWVTERAKGATPVLVAHNGRSFDLPMLSANLARVGAELPPDWWFLDTLKLAVDSRLSQSESLKQEALSVRYGVANARDGTLGRHRALGDARELARLLPHLQARAGAASMQELLMVRDAAGRVGDLAAQQAAPAKTKAAKKAQREADKLRDVMEHSVGFQMAEDPLSQVEAETGVFARRTPGARAPPAPVAPSAALAAGARAARAAQRARAQAHAAADTAAYLSMMEEAAEEGGERMEALGYPVPGDAAAASWAALVAGGSRGGEQTLLDVPLAQLGRRSFTARQCTMLREADVDTLGDLLRVFPRDHIAYARRLAPGRHVQLAGTVMRVKAAIVRRGRPMGFFELEAVVDASAAARAGGGALGEEDEEEVEDDLGFYDPLDGDQDPAAEPGSAAAEEAGEELALVPPEALQGMQTVRLKKVMMAYMATNVLALKAAHPFGSPIVLRGRLLWKAGRPGYWELDGASAMLYPSEADAPPGQVLPVYAQRAPVIPRDWAKLVAKALARAEADLPPDFDPLPKDMRAEHSHVPWLEAVRTMHAPTGLAELEAARRRLAFDELLALQLSLLLRRKLLQAPDGGPAEGHCIDDTSLVDAGRAALPFALTAGQEAALGAILGQLRAPAPMMCLLQGDVGCGKTAVAFLALLAAAGSGMQGALMAPTEVLAEQHAARLGELLERLPEGRRPRVALLKGGMRARERREVLAALAAGELDLLVGTHALISDDVDYTRLGLAIVDEQHRFGVEQRAKLARKARPPPHVLMMTATPIPRTLALLAHGDLTHAAIDELPPGRAPVATRVLVASEANRAQAYKAIRSELAEGGRAYIVCPLVDESAAEGMASLRAAEEEHRRLVECGVLGEGVGFGLLHGRLASDEKAAALRAFAAGDTQVLISTTVVEVGVDVREASVMLVEGAERFGLAQLHQLRGRVGRGGRPARCFLMASRPEDVARLAVLEASHNGFAIAEADLAIRGAGDIIGRRQSGRDAASSLRVARLPADRDLLEAARAAAARALARYGPDPAAWPPALLAAMQSQALPVLDLHALPVNALQAQAAAQAAAGVAGAA